MATVNLSSYTGTFHPFLNLGDAAYVSKWHNKNNTGEWFDASTDTRNWTLPSLATNATAASKSSAADGVGKPRYLYLSEIENLFVDANKKTLNISDIAYMNDNVSLSDQATAVGSVALGKVKAATKLVVLEGTNTNPEGKKYRLLKHVNNIIKAQQNGDTTIDAYVVTLNDIAPKTLSASDWFIINGHFKLIADAIKPLYRGVSKDDPESVVVIHQAEEGIAKAFFEASREAVEATGHIYDSTVITSYLAG